MRNSMYIGLALGMVVGALLVTNNHKVRNMVDETQSKIKQKIKNRGEEMVQNTCECACEAFSANENENI